MAKKKAVIAQMTPPAERTLKQIDEEYGHHCLNVEHKRIQIERLSMEMTEHQKKARALAVEAGTLQTTQLTAVK